MTTMICRLSQAALVAAAAVLPVLAVAQQPPGMDPGGFKPPREREDVVSWRTFAQVDLVKMKNRYVPQFSSNVTALDNQQVKVQGFMLPLEATDKQTHFLLSAMPPSCPFCMPGGPESMVEVRTKTPVKYGFEPFVVSGKLSVLRNDPTGIFYRIVDAELVK